MIEHMQHIQELKTYMRKKVESEIPGTIINGENDENSLYTVLNCCHRWPEQMIHPIVPYLWSS
jgi:cysteine sulfinate desulfinase/cysteine desulfurase-like protein